MTKNTWPFMDPTEWTKMMDPSRFMDWSKGSSEFRMPSMDWDAVMTAQRKNVEALVAAGQLCSEGMQAIIRRQTDLMRQTMQEATAAMGETITTGSPEEKVARQAEIARNAVEKALVNMKEVSAMITKSNTEAMDVIGSRVTESLEELRDLCSTTETGPTTTTRMRRAG